MFRAFPLRCSVTPTGGAKTRPYHRILQAIIKEGHGLLVATEIFKEFKSSYQKMPAYAQKKTSLDARGASAAPCKPLTEFSGDVREVEPLTVLLLKALCDLRRFDEIRFLFTQCLLELGGSTLLSIELFNVYLLAISMTDNYSQHEVENVIELMHSNAAGPDVVTKLSVFIIYLRLGQDSCVSWWKVIHDEVENIIAQNAVSRYPLLPLRMQHCFQTLIRLHHDVAVICECFHLLCTLRPQSSTPGLLLPYMILSIANEAAPPSTVVNILKIDESTHQQRHKGPVGAFFTSSQSKLQGPDGLSLKARVNSPLLNNEATLFRLLSKCLKWNDADATRYVLEYAKKYEALPIASEQSQLLISLLYVGALVRTNRLLEALEVLEGIGPPRNRPGNVIKLFPNSRRLLLDCTDPVQDVVEKIDRLGVDVVLDQLRGAILRGQRVTAVSLDLLIAACSMRNDVECAEKVLSAYSSFAAEPTCFSCTALLQCYAVEGSVFRRMDRLHYVMRIMTDWGVAGDDTFLREAMSIALDAGDLGCVRAIIDQHVELGIAIDSKQCVSLLDRLSIVVDIDGIRHLLRAMKSLNCVVDRKSLSHYITTFERWGIKCDDLTHL